VPPTQREDAAIASGDATLRGDLVIPERARGVVLFAHGSGSGRRSPRNRYVAELLQSRGLGTLLLDLLMEEEERLDAGTGHLRFDIDLLAKRVVSATEWVTSAGEAEGLRVGYFGASTGAAAALQAATCTEICAVVSRGGRPDLALEHLSKVKAPTLLIVGGNDIPVIPLNQRAHDELRCTRELVIVPDAGHLFEESGMLDIVASLAGDWFLRYLSLDEEATHRTAS